MEIHSLHEFMLHTKNLIYVLIVLILLAMPAIWCYLNEEHEEEQGHQTHHHH
jgi:hypothetical protein